jgi:hypothetical protein
MMLPMAGGDMTVIGSGGAKILQHMHPYCTRAAALIAILFNALDQLA